MKAGFFPVVFLMMLLASCEVQDFTPVIMLNPPLGLLTTQISNGIRLEFSSYNKEEYFSGFQVFVTTAYETTNLITTITNGSSLTHLTNTIPVYWSNIITNCPGASAESNLTTNVIPYTTAARRFSLIFTTNYDGSLFTVGTIYYFYVRSRSVLYNTNSVPSDIASVLIQ
jgi:hypothetical protein